MPKERFLNLPEEKKRRICKAAYEELTRVSYDELSINKIIQKAGIPRGSFYQYFEDKEDLLNYMMGNFKNCCHQNIRRAIQEGQGDIFYVFMEVLKEMIAFGEQEERCQVLKNVFSGLRVIQVQSFEVFQEIDEAFIKEMYAIMDLKDFKSRDFQDFLELVNLLCLLIRNGAAEIFMDISSKEEILKKVERRLEMIKHGVLKKEE